jgi:hypothetical protein
MEEHHPQMYALVCPSNGVEVDSDQRPAHMLRHVAYAVWPSSAEYFPPTQAVQGEVVEPIKSLYFPPKNAQFPPSGPVESALQEHQAEMEELHGRFARLSALAKEVSLEKRTLSLLSHYQVDDELGRDKQGGGAEFSLPMPHTLVQRRDRRQNIDCDSSKARNPFCSHVGYSTSICSDPRLPFECPASSSEHSKELLRVMLGIVTFDCAPSAAFEVQFEGKDGKRTTYEDRENEEDTHKKRAVTEDGERRRQERTEVREKAECEELISRLYSTVKTTIRDLNLVMPSDDDLNLESVESRMFTNVLP